jgi:structural maintenance of chromosome 2
LQNFELEMACLSNDLKAAVEAEVAAANALSEEAMHEQEIHVKVEELQSLYEEAKQDLDSKNDIMANRSTELAGLKSRKSSLAKEVDSIRLESKKLSLSLLNLKKERSASENLVTSMLKRHPWIETEKTAFGIRGGDYDFEANNPSRAQKRLKDLRADQEALVRFHLAVHTASSISLTH